MNLYIYNLQGTVYEGEASLVTLPAEDGEIGILKGHAPLVTSLKSGEIKIKGTEEKTVSIKKGFAYTDGTNTIVLAD